MLKRILLMLTLLAATSLMTGCFHQQVVYDSEYNASKTMPDHQATSFHIIGLVGVNHQLDLNQLCPGGTGLVENKTLFAAFVPPFIASQVVSVEQVSVYCK